MKNEDAQLINRFLTGDESAFTALVKKYQKSVHALAWRKVGDFHIAEELTQDTFLKAYEKLAMLKNPNQFAGWLYVIADRVCIAWYRKQKPQMESLETTSEAEINATSYHHYEDAQRENASVAYRRGFIKNLLEQLPESERTVVTLHYLGEMTCKAIGEFLGVSQNTVKSRLQRARNRLSEAEINATSYHHYEDAQRENASVAYRRGFIKNLLEQLPESERTVVTLHYLGEMTCKAIGEFLGVSQNTVKSRLQRARNRLKEQENIVQETLGGVHLPVDFTENIMRQVAEIKPVTPTSSKPIAPWAAATATVIFIFLIIGIWISIPHTLSETLQRKRTI